MKYSVGEKVLVMDVHERLMPAIIKGYMMVQRGEGNDLKEEFGYFIDEIELDIDQMYADLNIKLYHEDCIYVDEKEHHDRGKPMPPSLKKKNEDKKNK
jgi:hypothetical protein